MSLWEEFDKAGSVQTVLSPLFGTRVIWRLMWLSRPKQVCGLHEEDRVPHQMRRDPFPSVAPGGQHAGSSTSLACTATPVLRGGQTRPSESLWATCCATAMCSRDDAGNRTFDPAFAVGRSEGGFAADFSPVLSIKPDVSISAASRGIPLLWARRWVREACAGRPA